MENTNTIKLVLTEAQNTLWNSALKDLALYAKDGLSVYVMKYIEPGITDIAVTYYPVREEMENTVKLNPNIKDKSLCVNSTLRSEIDYLLTQTEPLDTSLLTAGVNQEASGINGSKPNYWEGQKTYQDSTVGEKVGEAMDTIINLNPEDINGNSTAITGEQRDNASGDNPLEGETPIE